MYQRFGFECGSILGLMRHHRISWGTYTDALSTHCDAHPNNMVIKLPTEMIVMFKPVPPGSTGLRHEFFTDKLIVVVGC